MNARYKIKDPYYTNAEEMYAINATNSVADWAGQTRRYNHGSPNSDFNPGASVKGPLDVPVVPK